MDDINVIDDFTATFTAYIDSGFGLLAGDVGFLTAILIGIDVVLAGLFWALAGEQNVLGQFVKKVLYVGAFAFIINNFALLANIVFESFAGLGLIASGSSLTAADLLKPGFVAATGFDAAYPLLEEASDLGGFPGFFNNFVTIAIILLAWLIVLFAFFILAIQLFVTILEFKLTTLAGFVLVPFALWNKTSFLAERVLGNVVASGVKLMVLAIIVGIGSTVFGAVTAAFTPGDVTLEQAASTILGSLSLLALGIFGPGIATGLVSGAPQLGAGAAVATAAGTGAAVVGAGALAATGAGAAARAGQSAVRAAASMAGGSQAAYTLGRAASGDVGWRSHAAGAAGAARAGVAGAMSRARRSVSRAFGNPGEAYQSGARAAFTATGGKISSPSSPAAMAAATNHAPNWAQKLRREQGLRDAGMTTAHMVASGDRPSSADAPKLRQEDD
ncbi:P-type conjugative transfer protein TrbL [Hyphococcus luteus]|uniref:P-type conjugative transfer protein TrbL n=1 Tax=Hyphococcus luteus TaxID=2058213 RepID=A0A2S7K9R3_9PROT|nr:P-type conjugative transfer protein TrbL [Marinicaulis flavus]PQA89232.1 P-type conjugative transfer protein TrbL [Marinicaulis flavus]